MKCFQLNFKCKFIRNILFWYYSWFLTMIASVADKRFSVFHNFFNTKLILDFLVVTASAFYRESITIRVVCVRIIY